MRRCEKSHGIQRSNQKITDQSLEIQEIFQSEQKKPDEINLLGKSDLGFSERDERVRESVKKCYCKNNKVIVFLRKKKFQRVSAQVDCEMCY